MCCPALYTWSPTSVAGKGIAETPPEIQRSKGQFSEPETWGLIGELSFLGQKGSLKSLQP